jgi:aromatic ring-opening dioxygenase LigB subunit
MASSHAYAFLSPADWDGRRRVTRARYKEKYGSEPPEVPLIERETLEANQQRFSHITDGLAALKRELEAFRPDALVLLGDDQDEHFREYIPQFAIYTGERFVATDRDARNGARLEYRNHQKLAEHLYASCVEAGIDLVGNRTFAGGELISHAHAQVLGFLRPQIPVIPIFLNAIHVPAPSPGRCYQFGETLLRALGQWPRDLRVAVYASGGLSHFSAGFPYPHYSGPFQVGSISEGFDHTICDWIRSGDGAKLATLSSSALLENGDIELRQWITLMGMIGDHKPEWLVYEAFYRGVMGMGVGFWAPFEMLCSR